MTSSRRRLQKNAAFMIFSIVVYLRTWITAPTSVNAPLNYFTVMGKLMIYPQGPTYYNFCYNKLGLGYQSLESFEAFIRLALFDFRVSSDSKKCTIAAIEEKYLQIICEKSLVSSQTRVFPPEVSNSSAQPTPRNCFRSSSAKTARSDAFQRSCSFGSVQTLREASGPTQRVGCRQRQSRLRSGLHSGLQ